MTLNDDGIQLVTPFREVGEMVAYLQERPTYHGHVKGAVSAHRYPVGNVTCWAPEDMLAAPAFFEFALMWSGKADAYLGVTPRLYSVNAFTTYPMAGPMNRDIQDWHRDKDDVRFVALFVYLTDVLTPEDGAHLFQRGTQNGAKAGPVETILGPAGTAFLADTRGLHMGIRPTSRPRSMAWARFGVSAQPASYVWDKQQSVSREVLGNRYPTSPVLQDMIRLVVE